MPGASGDGFRCHRVQPKTSHCFEHRVLVFVCLYLMHFFCVVFGGGLCGPQCAHRGQKRASRKLFSIFLIFSLFLLPLLPHSSSALLPTPFSLLLPLPRPIPLPLSLPVSPMWSQVCTSSGLATSTFTCQAISLAPSTAFVVVCFLFLFLTALT